MRIFGREPAAWVGVIEAALALTVALGWVNITAAQTALIMAAVTALFGVATAYLTKNTMLGVLVGLTKAIIALAIGFGFTISATPPRWRRRLPAATRSFIWRAFPTTLRTSSIPRSANRSTTRPFDH